MQDVISIYEAKTNLSKLVKRAQAGETLYLGAYGQAQAIIAPLPVKKKVNIGVWNHKRDPNFDDESLCYPDPEIVAEFEKAVNKPLD